MKPEQSSFRRRERTGILPAILWRGRLRDGSVALTFDDGPHPVHTARILDILRQHKVPAAFFPLGRHAERYPDLIREMSADGHLVGNHTYGHRHLIFVSRETARDELSKSSNIIESITAQRPRFFRPPRGLVGWNALWEASRMGMRTVLWTSSPRDWTRPGAGWIARRVLTRARGGSIVLLHDAKYDDLSEDRGQTVSALPAIIAGLKDRGYRLVSLDEMLPDRYPQTEVLRG
jgi:peptidoglycan/xylan/chitin deacetylase (PgdA/CDA1 family)